MLYNYKNFSIFESNDLRKTINLQEEYDRLNRDLFNGDLIKIPLSWERVRAHGGRVRYNQLVKDGKITNSDIRLSMSDFFNYDYDTFINALAHEMIHVYIAQNNIKEIGGGHGIQFQNKMNEINKKGYKVVLTINAEHMDMTNTAKLTKPIIVLLVEDSRGKNKMTVFDYKLYTKEFVTSILSSLNRMSKYYGTTYKYTLLESYNRSYQKAIPIKRVLKNFGLYDVTNSKVYDDMKNDENNKILLTGEIK